MMRSSLQAGPSIKYEVVNLQAGSSDLMRCSLFKAGPSIKYEVVNLQAGSSDFFGWEFEVNILIFITSYIHTFLEYRIH